VTAARAAVIYTPLPDAECARDIAGTLLDEGLIACANILGPVEAVFLWNGKRESASEVGVLFKTSECAVDQAVDRLGKLHPYETPAIVANVCSHAHADTLDWLASLTH